MSKDKIKILLTKIQSLAGDEKISLIEKDLLKDYLKQLYILVDKLPVAPSLHEAKSKHIPPEPLRSDHQFSPDAKDEIEKPITDEEERTEEERKPYPSPDQREETGIGNGEQIVDIPFVKQETKINLRESMPHENEEIQAIFTRDQPTPANMALLFEGGQSNDLSAKLANTPISDLTRAFSINERLLFINELFNGNDDVFLDIVDVLNRKFSFEEAKSYLIRYVIDEYNWMDEKRVERGQEFITFVKRRYLD